MLGKLITVLALFIGISSFSYAQKKTAIVKGKIINNTSGTPLNDIKVSIPALNVFTRSDGEGKFEISEVPFGTQTIIVSGVNEKSDTISTVIDKDIVDLKDVKIAPNDNGVSLSTDNFEIPTIPISSTEASGSDMNDGSSLGGEELLFAGKDPFVNAVVYVFGGHFFKPRGQRNQNEAEINGISINNAQTGFLSWTQQLGSQNDVFRGKEVRYGLEPSPYTFGGVNGSTYISAIAADQQKETKISYSTSNGLTRNKIMLTTSSGLMKNGWAYTLSANKRWSEEGYFAGTSMDAYSYYGSVSKVIKKSTLSLTSFGVPMKQAKARMATQECFDLARNNYYNQDWGYQTSANGGRQMRSDHIQNVFQPTTIFNYDNRLSDKTTWRNSFGYQFGKDRNSYLDGYNSSSPYGNYYRKLPSYYLNLHPPDSATAASVKLDFLKDPTLLQINWDRLYNDNRHNTETIYDVHGIVGNNVTGLRSQYVMEDNVNDLKKFTFNTNVEHTIDQHITFNGGITAFSQNTRFYKQLTDLLGGEFFVNYNQFASQQTIGNPNYNQNNLNDPNAIIKVGDKYGYDYTMNITNALAWGQAVFNYNKLDFFIAGNVGDNFFSRIGYMKNGLFPNNSYGSSATHNFLTYATKGGMTYKVNSRNFLFVNAAYIVTPPSPNNIYISADTRDFTVSSPAVQKNLGLEGGYLLRSSKINARAVGYVNDVKNATEIKRFFNDDPNYYTFVNYVMQNENTRSIGTELMLEYKVIRQLSVIGVAALGQAFYTNNPDVSVYLDNDTLQHSTPAKSYIKNYYLSAGPQTAYTLGTNYHSDKYWFGNINFTYVDRNYVEINPNRRTAQAATLVTRGSAQWNSIYEQEKLPSAFSVDLHMGKSFQLSRLSDVVKKASGNNTILVITLGVNNLLNNTDIIVRGREQFRYDFTYRNPERFPNQYQYGYGITYNLNISLKF